jgi:hypothetical protein
VHIYNIYHGGIRPPSIRPCFCVCNNAHANVIGFCIPLNINHSTTHTQQINI